MNDAVADLLREKLGERVYVRSQNPIVLDDFSEPEPDVVLCQPPGKKYVEKHPTPEDIFLIAEISDSTLGRDRFAKGAAYAEAGISQRLIINVQEETVEDYRQPSAGSYNSKQTHRRDGEFDLAAFAEIRIRVDDLF